MTYLITSQDVYNRNCIRKTNVIIVTQTKQEVQVTVDKVLTQNIEITDYMRLDAMTSFVVSGAVSKVMVTLK